MISLNPADRISYNALICSRRVSFCRRAYRRARARRDKRVWYVMEEKNMASICSYAVLLERLLTIKQALPLHKVEEVP